MKRTGSYPKYLNLFLIALFRTCLSSMPPDVPQRWQQICPIPSWNLFIPGRPSIVLPAGVACDIAWHCQYCNALRSHNAYVSLNHNNNNNNNNNDNNT